MPIYQKRPLSEQMEMIDILDLGDRPRRQAEPNLHNSASKFLLEVYNEISEDQEPKEVLHQRHKRSLDDDISSYLLFRFLYSRFLFLFFYTLTLFTFFGLDFVLLNNCY